MQYWSVVWIILLHLLLQEMVKIPTHITDIKTPNVNDNKFPFPPAQSVCIILSCWSFSSLCEMSSHLFGVGAISSVVSLHAREENMLLGSVLCIPHGAMKIYTRYWSICNVGSDPVVHAGKFRIWKVLVLDAKIGLKSVVILLGRNNFNSFDFSLPSSNIKAKNCSCRQYTYVVFGLPNWQFQIALPICDWSHCIGCYIRFWFTDFCALSRVNCKYFR